MNTLLISIIIIVLAIFLVERLGISWLTRQPQCRQWIRTHRCCHPNAISIVRIPMGLLSVWMWHQEWHVFSILWFAVWMISDLTDGTIARNCDLVTESGKWLDPLSDKCLYFPPLIYFAVLGTIPPLWVALIIIIDTLGQFSRLLPVKKAANSFGKTKTALITVLLFLCAFYDLAGGSLPLVNAKFLEVLTASGAILAFLSVYCKVIPDMWYANSLSLANFLCGVGAIVLVMRGQLLYAFILVFVGQFFDLFDGRMARKFGSTRYGAVFDDIADGTSFGLAIAVLVAAAIQPLYIALPLAVVHLLCVLYRLIRFLRDRQVMPEGVFSGLPSPAGALLTGSAVLLFKDFQVLSWFFIILAAILMVSHVQYRHFAQRIWPELPNLFKISAFLLVLIFVNTRLTNRALAGTLELMCFAFAVSYMILGIDCVAGRLLSPKAKTPCGSSPTCE